MIPLKDPQSTFEEDYHRHEFYTEDGKTHLATIEFDDIDDEGAGKLFCEVTVWVRVGTTSDEPIIAFERANLLTKGNASTGLKSIVNKLGDAGSVNWEMGFDTAAYRSVSSYRRDSSEGGWMDFTEATTEDPYILRPYILKTNTTILFGPPGSNKSMLAMQWGLSVATGTPFEGVTPTVTGPVMYVDFEDEKGPQDIRFTAMALQLGLDKKEMQGLIWHERVRRTMKDARRRLRRIVREKGIVLVIVDSVGQARGSDVNGSEGTIKLFKMFAQLGVPVLAIDHMTKENNIRVATGKMNAQEATPIGSQFSQAAVRLGWFINIMPQSTGRQKKANLYNTKYNHTAQHEPVGMTIDINWNDLGQLTKVVFSQAGSSFDAEVAKATKLKEFEKLVLWHHRCQVEGSEALALTQTEMADSDVRPATIRGAIRDYPDLWIKNPKTKRYILSPTGLEMAHFLDAMHPNVVLGNVGGMLGTGDEGVSE